MQTSPNDAGLGNATRMGFSLSHGEISEVTRPRTIVVVAYSLRVNEQIFLDDNDLAFVPETFR